MSVGDQHLGGRDTVGEKKEETVEEMLEGTTSGGGPGAASTKAKLSPEMRVGGVDGDTASSPMDMKKMIAFCGQFYSFN